MQRHKVAPPVRANLRQERLDVERRPFSDDSVDQVKKEQLAHPRACIWITNPTLPGRARDRTPPQCRRGRDPQPHCPFPTVRRESSSPNR